MKIYYNLEEPNKEINHSIFLAGPSGTDDRKTWRSEAIKIFKKFDYMDHIFFPEDNPIKSKKIIYNSKEFDEQMNWERKYLNKCDCILYWGKKFYKPAQQFISDIELGEYFKSGKVIAGARKRKHEDCYLRKLADEIGLKWFIDLEDCIKFSINMVYKL